jgi:hypothetical protein
MPRRDMRTRNHQNQSGGSLRCPHAFTLFEVLIALSLSMLLVSAIYAGLSLYWRYSSAGHVEVERALLARALLRRIELDVRSVMYRPPAATTATDSSGSGTSGSGASGSGSGGSGSGTGGTSSGSGSSGSGSGGSGASGSGSGSGSGSSDQSTTTQTTTTPDDAYATSTTGLFGNATTLMMHVSKPAHEQMAALLAASGNEQTRVSDLATVAYFVSGTATGTLQQSVNQPGLARLEGDRLAMAMADQQQNVAAMASKTELLAAEVTAIRFQYFDGFRWCPSWDSSVYGGLPKAIDVEIAMQPTAGSSRPGLQGTAAGTATVYKLVIAIPLAKPIDTSTISTTQ